MLKRANSIKASRICTSKQSECRKSTEMYVLERYGGDSAGLGRSYMCGEAVVLVTGCRLTPSRLLSAGTGVTCVSSGVQQGLARGLERLIIGD
jgi:hypothetical protein